MTCNPIALCVATRCRAQGCSVFPGWSLSLALPTWSGDAENLLLSFGRVLIFVKKEKKEKKVVIWCILHYGHRTEWYTGWISDIKRYTYKPLCLPKSNTYLEYLLFQIMLQIWIMQTWLPLPKSSFLIFRAR